MRLLMSRRCRRTKHETEPSHVAGYLTGGGPSSPRRPVMLSNLIESFTVCARKRFAKRIFLLALPVLAVFAVLGALPRASYAQSAEPAAAAPAAAAPAAAAPALDAKAIEERLGDLEAYVNNGARVSKESKVAGAGPGHNAWMMVSAALVLFMTLPGLALFYGGLVRTKNVLSVMAQCLGSAGMDAMPNGDYAAWVSQNVFSMYQLMFAIITPALIVGAIAERMKYSALMLFMAAWMFVVYFPLAHMVWGVDGFMNGVWNANAGIKAIDFAGGTVVHMSSGWSAIVLALIVGKRRGFGKESFAPHSLVLTMIGTGMLWVG